MNDLNRIINSLSIHALFVKPWFQFSLNRPDPTCMEFLYLRIGSGEKLFEELNTISAEKGISWQLNESDSFAEYHFSSNYTDFDGAVLNVGISDDEILDFRKDFWENFVWKTEDKPLVTALIIPNSNKLGSLTKAQVIESLSLVRLTDRPFEIFEMNDSTSEDVLNWIMQMSIYVHRKLRVEPETKEK